MTSFGSPSISSAEVADGTVVDPNFPEGANILDLLGIIFAENCMKTRMHSSRIRTALLWTE